ncbi:hypothetical protein K490DRAFT_66937 [Saccharata proteae CBS 121410]|uniref:RNA-dependent RNA polymerase n=1 Tax=Saccharata proteae CBS 121410 TaxID=1314787 RepID=A0A9P4HTS0_9PEZI|nr:hypothetical protein K490DRAFT_66937 [Saccharata proteae CBS 121410]
MEPSEKLGLMPFKFRWEIVRVALATGISDPDILLPPLGDNYRDYDAFWSYLENHESCRKLKMPDKGSEKAWDLAEGRFDNVTLKADLVYNKSNRGPFFNLSLKPLEKDKSCRFQRAFGGDRFLYVQVPPIRSNFIPKGKGTEDDVRLRYEEWLVQPDKPFLGRYWTIFHVENIKSKTMQRESKATRQRLVLFATHGFDIKLKPEANGISPRKSGPRKVIMSSEPEASVSDVLDWFMPLKLNAYQPFTKAFARLDLGLSRTDAGIKFLPSQVRFVKDTLADGSREDRSFNDRKCKWVSPHDPKNPQVMNDGCSRISIGALLAHWRSKSLPGPVPSAVQGRIGGAKGVWIISASTDTTDPEHLDHWIEISDSQLKFKPHPRDDCDETYDQNRLLFEPLASSAPPSSSSLNKAFFPILLDRGIPKERLRDLVTMCLHRNREALLDAVQSDDLRRWVNSQNSLNEERNRDGMMTWQGGLPMPLGEKVVLLLESGFNPQECPYLANIVVRMVQADLLKLRHKFDIPVARSTFVLGIADPIGVLAPGQVHLMFSQNFSDDVTGESKMYLDNLEVLVARHPALRNSDIQKVKAVFKKELDHLRDVIVFPSKGEFPLAGKLQGGDYDGDRFWVSWEPSLTNGFKNAPAPYTSPIPEDYGISVDRRTLGEIQANQWLQESFKFRNKPELLGVVTKLHGRVSYKQNQIDSYIVNKLVDLHDLLVDSSKNGYVFDDAAYKKFVTTQLRLNLKDIKDQAYEQGMQLDEANRRKHGKTKTPKIKYNPNHILDHLYWEVIVPHTEETLRQLSRNFDDSTTLYDPDLLDPFENELQDAMNSADTARAQCLEALEAAVKELRPVWNRLTTKDPDLNNPDDYNDALEKTYSHYLSIAPLNPTASASISAYLSPITPGGPCRWAVLRASAFAGAESEVKRFEGRRQSKWASGPTCLFHIAGRELCFIKAMRVGGWRVLRGESWGLLKPRRGRKKGVVQVVEEMGEGWESEEEGEVGLGLV